jgi:hypothetical protein
MKKIWIHWHRAPIRVVKIQRKRSFLKLRRQMLILKVALSQEKAETRHMLTIYKKYSQRQATKDELAIANKQFVDLVKGLGLGVLAVLPFSPITLPLCIKLGRWVGVDILPSAFTNQPKAPSKPRVTTEK